MADKSHVFHDLVELKIMWAGMDVRAATVGLSWQGTWEGVLGTQFTCIKQVVVFKA